MANFGLWLKNQSWHEIYHNDDVNFKANFLQNTLMSKFCDIFPLKTVKISEDDEPWFTEKL